MNFMLNKKLLYCYIVILLIGFCFIFTCNVLAQSIMSHKDTCNCGDCSCDTTASSECCKYCCGDYGLDDFAQIFINYYARVLGIVGSLALLMFIYGGLMFLISSGNSEKVTQAKQIIVGAVIGLVIVFASYMIIQFIFTALGITGGWATSGWFGK